MALLFMDSFDHYVTADLTEKWTTSGIGTTGTNAISAANGRAGTASYRATGTATSASSAWIHKTVAPADNVCIVGFRWKASALPGLGSKILVIMDGATGQVCARVLSDGTLQIVRGTSAGTVLGVTTAAMSPAVFTYVTLKVTIHNTAGTVAVWFNGLPAMTPLTSQNTRSSATNTWTGVRIGANVDAWDAFSATLDFDDLYVSDGSGSAPWNDQLGDVRCDPLYPTAAGATTQFTPLAGSNWQNVDDTAPDDDTTYNSSVTIGHVDTFVVQDAPVVGGTIYGIQHCVAMKKMDAGTCSVAPVIRHSGVDYPGADLAPAITYGYGLQIAAINPGTGVAWTEAGFNAAEFGYKKTV